MTSTQLYIPELRALLAEGRQILDEAARIEPGAGSSNYPSSDVSVHHLNPTELADLLKESKEDLDKILRIHLGWPAEAATTALSTTAIIEAPAIAADSLEESLRRCQAATETGYRKASAHVAALGQAVGQIEAVARRLARDAGKDSADSADPINRIVQALKDSQSALSAEVENKRKNLATFNITLFGRTMTGKSTLMEILTHGNGQSIGKGSQRTTRDVRPYQWQGMTVTDVPGVAAFGGDDDVQIAHQAAVQSDLVLFLISDDGPQAAEAEHLARLRQQGKAVLGIFNVKEGINANNEVSVRRFVRDHEKLFDPARLQEISRQFDEMTDQHVPGQEIELVASHLHSRYLAGIPENAGKPWRDDLERASRFQNVEDRILREVATNGPFLRTHSFLNIAAVANLQAYESTRESADLCDRMQRRLNDRSKEVRSWRTGFVRSANQQIDRLIQQTVGNLRNQISDFVNEHLEDRNLSDLWNACVRNAGIDQKCQALQRDLARECQDFFKQLAADVQQELELLENQLEAVSLETGTIANSRRRWKWSVTGVSGTLVIAAAAAFLVPIPGVNVALSIGLGVASAAVGIVGGLIGRLFGNRDQKRREATAKITPELRQNLDGIERQVRANLEKWLDDFIGQYVNKEEEQFHQLAQAQGRAASLLRNITARQRESLLAANQEAIEQALQHLGQPDLVPGIRQVARIPGQAVVLATGGHRRLPAVTADALRSLLSETVVQAPDDISASNLKSSLRSGGLDETASDRLVAQLAEPP